MKSPEICRGSSSFDVEGQHLYVELLKSKKKKETLKKIGGNSVQHSHGVENSVCASQPDWKTSGVMGNQVLKYKKSLASVVGNKYL